MDYCEESADGSSSPSLGYNTSSDEFDYDEDELGTNTSSSNSDDAFNESKYLEGIPFFERRVIVPVDERIGCFLTNTPPIVESILSNLNAMDLNRCARVCKLWNIQANILKGKKNNIFRMFEVIHTNPTYNHGVRNPPESKLYMSSSQYSIGNHFWDVLKNAPFEPRLGIIFCSEAIISKPHHHFLTFTRKKLRVKELRRFGYGALGADFISDSLPSECSFIICTASGVIGTPTNIITPIEVENYRSLSAFFLPEKIPGVEILHFSVPDNRYYRKRQKVSESSNEILKDKNVKCVLFFLKHMPRPDGEFFKSFLANHFQNGKPSRAIAGIISQKVFYQNCAVDKFDENDLGCGIAFSGSNVNAASIVLDPEIKTKEQVLIKLEELKNSIKLGKKTIALLLACCGRGKEHYKKKNVESTCFYKIFPNIPLYGMFGNGEIGVDFLPNQNKDDSLKFEKEFKPNVFYSHKRRNREPAGSNVPQTWFHAYTSIFALITWN